MSPRRLSLLVLIAGLASARAEELQFSGTLGLNLGEGEIRDSQGALLDRSYREAVLDTDLAWRNLRLNTALAWQQPAEFPDTRSADSTLIRKASLLRASWNGRGPCC
jgi:hypothetical protein